MNKTASLAMLATTCYFRGANVADKGLADAGLDTYVTDAYTVAGQLDIPQQWIANSRIHVTETEAGLVVEATINDILSDMISGAGRFIYPPPIAPTRTSRVRCHIGAWLYRLAQRVADDDFWDDSWS